MGRLLKWRAMHPITSAARVAARVSGPAALCVALAAPACVVQEPGTGDLAAVPAPAADAATPRSDARPGNQPPWPEDALDPPPMLLGPPAEVGCADGSREGFLDVSAGGWPSIAGCAGGFSEPGLLPPAVETPRCDRMSGNTSSNPTGQGCSARDLCALGWHVCRGPSEVAARSVSACESSVPPGTLVLFAVAAGAEPAGHCTPNPSASNDVHGCGNYGQPESELCFPLDRRLGVADCRASGGIWRCGEGANHLEEARLASKSSPLLGGVLCCRD